jgi:hypothetical protein
LSSLGATPRAPNGELDEAPDEAERHLGDLMPAIVDRERVAAAWDLDDLGDSLVAPLLLEGGVGYSRETVWSFSPEMISSGPRSGFVLFTFTSVHGFRLAVAAWKSGTPAAGTAKVS